MTNLQKTFKEIEFMKEGGKKLSAVCNTLVQLIKPGVNLLEIEEKAVQLIKAAGGEPAFCRVPGYHWATCLNINEEIVHAIPRDCVIKNGDVVNIDIGMFYKGLNTDMSSTVYLEDPNPKPQIPSNKEVKRFLEVGKKALKEAIKVVKPGRYIGHISQKIQKIIEKAGYSCNHYLTGHGIGAKLHEQPAIPCFLLGSPENTPPIKQGMVLAIEIIYCFGKPDLEIDPKSKWTIRTKDGKISAVFEVTICVTKKGAQVLTKLPFLSCLKDE